jgi:hypothetical protein
MSVIRRDRARAQGIGDHASSRFIQWRSGNGDPDADEGPGPVCGICLPPAVIAAMVVLKMCGNTIFSRVRHREQEHGVQAAVLHREALEHRNVPRHLQVG